MLTFEEIIEAIPQKPYYLDLEYGQAIYCADCRDILPSIPDKSIDLVLTSPPYDDLRLYGGQGFQFSGMPSLFYKPMADGACCVWIVGDQTIEGSETGSSFRQALAFMEGGFNLHDTMIYAKDGYRYPESVRYLQQFEFMFIFSKGKPKTFNAIQQSHKYNYVKAKYMTERQRNGTFVGKVYSSSDNFQLGNIWFYDVGYMKSSKADYVFEHPAIFPEALANDHIISWSNPNDVILDPFLGSGTTAYCAKKLGRKCIGIEIEEKYCEIVVKRLSQSVMSLNIDK